MLEAVIAVVVAVVLWNLRTAFYGKSQVFKEQVDINVKKSETELQDDYAELADLVKEKKTQQNGKWFGMKDIENLMHSDATKK